MWARLRTEFSTANQGSVAIIFAFALIALLGIAALAIDFGRYYSVRTKLGQALDRSALAGAKLMVEDGATDEQVRERTRAFFETQANLLGIPVASGVTLNIDVQRATNTIGVVATLPLPTTLARVIGINQLDIRQKAEASFRISRIEVAFALDLTGSMAALIPGESVTRLQALQASTRSIVDTLFDLAPNDAAVRIALAPYSAAVNAGSYATTVTGNAPWENNCVVERLGSENATDAPPTGANRLRAVTGSLLNPPWTDCPLVPVRPLSGRNNRTAIHNAISAFGPIGATAGHIGTAWGWYLVSHRWASMFPTANRPSEPGSDVVKNVIVMTDGEFNVAYLNGAATGDPQEREDSYTQFRNLCTNMRNDSINVYTIAFGLISGGRAETELQDCATTPSNFFSTANSAELQAAFARIADRITQLRLSK